ncbi:hypothetical protein ACHHYP_15372 [Achlya hypogyna]|uniref:JmjC domain-containing protein n=1 Tax=Achlya hypogyna TaxID=1202772 RepID=A0A1V9YB13_ACHHY|nr:hypothetical protein ACHHYP_15372 [Achlya hypogyna]
MDQVPRVDAGDLSYAEFCTRFMAPNLPVLVTNVGSNWPVVRDWVDAQRRLRFEELRDRYGQVLAPVVASGAKNEYGDETRDDVVVATYLEWLESGRAEAEQLYLKDWHFTRDFPSDDLYSTPEYFADDWLNWCGSKHKCLVIHLWLRWWDRKARRGDKARDDYRFVYLGPSGSFTPLHHDVFQSYSWSINISGQKEWLLFPPSETPKLLDRLGRSVPSDVRQIDATKYPMAHLAQALRVLQPPGAALFVPSGWYHQVTNTATTLSINHNWFNAYNLATIWRYFQAQLAEVEREIEHCRDSFDSAAEWSAHCQLLLRANIGMDYGELHALLQARLTEATNSPFTIAQIELVLAVLGAHPSVAQN